MRNSFRQRSRFGILKRWEWTCVSLPLHMSHSRLLSLTAITIEKLSYLQPVLAQDIWFDNWVFSLSYNLFHLSWKINNFYYRETFTNGLITISLFYYGFYNCQNTILHTNPTFLIFLSLRNIIDELNPRSITKDNKFYILRE